MEVVSLFAGIGGIDLAFQQAGYRVLLGTDVDADACTVYAQNLGSVLQRDIRRLRPYELPAHDVLTAGFPCQPFSVCGAQKGFQDARGNLFFEIMRIVDAKQPSVIFLENVANLVEHDGGRTFQVIHAELASRDYYIRYAVLDACEFGVPQHRTRTYIVAFRDASCCARFRFPVPSGTPVHIFDVIDRAKRADDASYVSPGCDMYHRLNAAMRDADQLYRFSDYGIQSSQNGVSFTLKANMGTWPNRVPFLRDAFGIRTITPSECLALQGFPDSFRIGHIPPKSAYRCCGNTVCVPVVRQIAEQIAACMASNEA